MDDKENINLFVVVGKLIAENSAMKLELDILKSVFCSYLEKHDKELLDSYQAFIIKNVTSISVLDGISQTYPLDEAMMKQIALELKSLQEN